MDCKRSTKIGGSDWWIGVILVADDEAKEPSACVCGRSARDALQTLAASLRADPLAMRDTKDAKRTLLDS